MFQYDQVHSKLYWKNVCLVLGFQKNAEKKTNLFHLIVQISFQCEIIF